MSFTVQYARTNGPGEKMMNVVQWDDQVEGPELVIWLTQMGNRIVREETPDGGFEYWMFNGVENDPFGPGDWFVFYNEGRGYPESPEDFAKKYTLLAELLERNKNALSSD